MSNVRDDTTVGTTVHYVSYGTPGGEYLPACRAAIITEAVGPKTVGLCVLNPSGQFFDRDKEHSTVPGDGGTWHYLYECDDIRSVK